MAIIVVLHHRLRAAKKGPPYMINTLATLWGERGHRVIHHYGTDDPPGGDLAVLHVDLTRVPSEYAALAARYPRAVNGGLLDISKRTFSQQIVQPGDDWDGPVMVKTDANFRGKPELVIARRAARAGVPLDGPPTKGLREYPVFASLRKVPEHVWRQPHLIVEKFLPERDERGRFCLRVWSCLGDRDRSVRWRGPEPMVKAPGTVEREEGLPVPEELRAWRRRLGVDFGKLDFVLYEGCWVLLDVNKTPTYSRRHEGAGPHPLAELAGGIDDYLG